MSAADEAVRRGIEEAQRSVAEWEAKALAAGGVCDFCAHKLVPGRYSTWVTGGIIEATFSVLEETPVGIGAGSTTLPYDPFWAACDACDVVVAKKDPEALADYVLENRDLAAIAAMGLPTAELPPEALRIIRGDLVELYRTFYSLEPVRGVDLE